MMLLRLTVLTLFFSLALRAPGAELPPASLPIPAVIDQIVAQRLAEEGITPAPQADDATLIRRLTLDLAGRIPTPSEVEEYVSSTEPDKRLKLVTRLMASPSYARHQAMQFDAMLNDKPGSGGRNGSLRDYLTRAMTERKSWDRIFQELMLPDDADESLKGASVFLTPRLRDADQLTNDVSILFFGVNVSCAQCHDHPLVEDWTQDHFYGMKAFLARTYDANGFIAERGVGQIRYKPNTGAEKAAAMMFLSGQAVKHETDRAPTKDEEKREKEAVEKAKEKKVAPPAPEFSARAKLVEIALQDTDGNFLARSIVNRLWHRFLGTGLVTPLDQMHSENPASHPALLAWLARDFRSHGHDLHRLIQGIVLSETYSRASIYPSASYPDRRLFAVAELKPLTPWQLTTSLKIANTDPAALAKLKPGDFEKRIEGFEASSRGFANMLIYPGDNFQVSVSEALLFSNSDRMVKEFLTDGNDTLLRRTVENKDRTDAIQNMVKSVLSRPATTEEVNAFSVYLESRQDRTPEAYRQILWALVTSSEFRFCH